MRLILICTIGGARVAREISSGHTHRVFRVVHSEHGRLAHLVVDRVRRVHGLGDRQARRGAGRHEGLES